MTSPTFKVLLTADFYDAEGRPKFGECGLSEFSDQPQIEVSAFDEHRPEIGADQVAGAQGVIALSPKVTSNTLSNAADLLAQPDIDGALVGGAALDVESFAGIIQQVPGY